MNVLKFGKAAVFGVAANGMDQDRIPARDISQYFQKAPVLITELRMWHAKHLEVDI